MTEHETEIPAESAEQIRQIAREEARDVYDDEVVEADGEEWSVRSMMDRFEISRRTALGAMGLLIAGVVADPAEAVMRSYVGTAEAQTGDLTVPGTLSADAVSTASGSVNGNTMIGAPSSSSQISATLGGGWVTESSDRPVLLFLRIRAVTDGTTRGLVTVDVDESGGTGADFISTVALAESTLPSGTTIDEVGLILLPAGASYSIQNDDDPTGNNSVETGRKFVL